jgi:TPR repeat protein
MRRFYNGKLGGAVVAFALMAQSANGQAPSSAAPAAAADIVDDVTIQAPAKRYEKSPISAAQRALKVDRTSASSGGDCFDVRADNYIEDYIAAVTGAKAPGPNLPALDPFTGSRQSGTTVYFSENAPFGVDASIDPEDLLGVCMDGWRFIAGRATIARHDKTLPEGYKLYDAQQYPQALASFTKAYRKLPDKDGGKEAALMIGKINLMGARGTPDMKEAVLWLTRAATANFNPSVSSKDTPAFDPEFPEESLTTISEAAISLGRIYLTGQGVPKDPKAARKWFERASYVGYVPAGKTLGDIHFYGYDTPRDIKKAVDYYTKAATVGYAPAQYSLAEIYYYGEPGIEPNQAKALGWYEQAARLKHPGALYALAVAYDSGEGVVADPSKALAFYRDAALAGNVDAQSAMGSYFYEGSGGVAKDDVAARQWFDSAARQGQKDAMFNLGVMQMKGEGGPKNLVLSWVWLRLAKSKGYPNADAALAAVEKQMSAEELATAAGVLKPKTAG